MVIKLCDGKVLICGDKLRTTCCPDDYCGPPVTDCPRCCTKIVGGVWDTDHWRFNDNPGNGYVLTVKVFGIAEDRLVCDETSITVEFTLTVPDPNPQGPPHFAFASWDYMWEYEGHTPNHSNTDGEFFSYGLIKWGSVNDLTYEVDLKYKSCYQSSNRQVGDITVGFEQPDTNILIEFQDCPGYNCCDEPAFVCDPCCWFIAPGDGSDPATDGIIDPDTQVLTYWAEADGVLMRVEVRPGRQLFCADGGGTVQVNVLIIPSPESPANYEPEICITHPGWYATDDQPTTKEECENYEFEDCADPEELQHSFGGIAYGCEANPCANDGCFEVPGNILITAKTHLDTEISVSTGELVQCPPGNQSCCCDCDPCDFPQIDPVQNVVFFYDDGLIAIQFTQTGPSLMQKCEDNPDEDCAGCLFSIPGRWTIVDFQNNNNNQAYDGGTTMCFFDGDYKIEGGVQGGVAMEYEMPGSCDGLQTSPPDDVFFLEFDANGSECEPEGEE